MKKRTALGLATGISSFLTGSAWLMLSVKIAFHLGGVIGPAAEPAKYDARMLIVCVLLAIGPILSCYYVLLTWIDSL